MADDPSEEDISLVVEITQADRDTAIKYLKAKQNDASKAITALLDGENISADTTGWDESAFDAPRDGPWEDVNATTLKGTSAAPTRGPSPAPSLQHPKTRAEEDSEMERALAMSRGELALEGQETGIMNASGQTMSFGPAQQTQYDSSKWAMTHLQDNISHNTVELTPDVEPHARRHVDPTGPRFLKPLPGDNDYLPNFITIGHAIPLLRESWLMRGRVLSDYGQDAEWWRGANIELPRISTIDEQSQGKAANETSNAVVTELQRLVAFLDSSSRLYASAQSLATQVESCAVEPSSNSTTLIDRTISSWTEAATRLTIDASTDVDCLHTIIGSSSPDQISNPHLWTLPLIANTDSDSESATVSLAEVLDNTLWDTDPDETDPCDSYLERCADVLVMRLSPANAQRSTLGVIAPSEVYVDRYLKSNVEVSRAVRKDMANVRRRINMIEKTVLRLQGYDHLKSVHGDTAGVIEHTRRHYSGVNRDAVIADREARGMQVEVPALPVEYQAISVKLEAVCSDVAVKLQVLQQETARAKTALDELSQSIPSGLDQKHKYTLCGVATKPSVTYILRPRPDKNDDNASTTETSSNAITFTTHIDEDDPEAPPGMQWWRIEYDVPHHGSSRVMTTISTTDDVLRAIELEHKTALMVYASERARNPVLDASLPLPLQAFIARDDALFEKERSMPALPPQPKVSFDDWPRDLMTHDIGPTDRKRSFDSTNVNFDDDTEMQDRFGIEERGAPPAYDEVQFEVAGNDRLGRDSMHDDVAGATQMHFVKSVDDGIAIGGHDDEGSPPVHEFPLTPEDGEHGLEHPSHTAS